MVGTALAALGMASLALVLAQGSGPVVPVLMALLGLGIGLVMQVMVLVAQNAADGPAILRQQFLFAGAPVADEVIVGIVDEDVLPLLTRRMLTRRT